MVDIEESNKSSLEEEVKEKVDALLKGFSEIDINDDNQLTKEQIKSFLRNRKINGKEFDPILTNKLFEQLNVNDDNPTIETGDFVKRYIQFESDINKEAKKYSEQYKNAKLNYEQLNEECRKYQEEKVNKEGFCENAKVTVIIEDVDIKSKIEGIQSISIKLIYNDDERETEFISGSDNNQINQKFEL